MQIVSLLERKRKKLEELERKKQDENYQKNRKKLFVELDNRLKDLTKSFIYTNKHFLNRVKCDLGEFGVDNQVIKWKEPYKGLIVEISVKLDE